MRADYAKLKALITELRRMQLKDSITPEHVGYLMQRLLDRSDSEDDDIALLAEKALAIAQTAMRICEANSSDGNNWQYMGDWRPGTAAEMLTLYSYIGALWLCVNPNGTSSEPSLDSPDWRLVAGSPASMKRLIRFSSEYGEFERGIFYGERVQFRAWVSDALLNDYSNDYEGWTITRDTGNAASDGVWNATRANIDEDGIFYIEWGGEHDDLQAEHATFTVTAFLKGSSGKKISQSLII